MGLLEKSIIDAIDHTNLKMTELGFSVSQMVQDAVAPSSESESDDEQYLEAALQMGRRRRTGVRGRPKSVDYGFGKSSTTHKMAPEAARLMGTANMAFVSRDYDKAQQLLLQVIQVAPNSFEPYHTLGLVWEEQGEREKASGFYMLAALINPSNAELWQKLADWAQEDERKREEAIFCLTMAINAAKEDDVNNNVEDNYWRRARLLLANNQPQEAVRSFVKLLSTRLDDIGLVKRVSKLAISQDISMIAAQVLERAARRNKSKVSWSYLNLLLELLFMSNDNEGKIIELVKEYSMVLLDQTLLLSNPQWGVWSEEERQEWLLSRVPIEIYLKYAIAVVKCDHVGMISMSRVLQCNPETDTDLLHTLADCLYTGKHYQSALDCFTLLQSNEASWSVRSCCLQGHCLVQLSRHTEAIDAYKTCLMADPGYEEARVALAECYKIIGDEEGVLETLESGRLYKRARPVKRRVAEEEDDIWSGSESEEDEEDESDSDDNYGSLLLNTVRKERKSTRSKKNRQSALHEYSAEECQRGKQEYTRILLALQVGSTRKELYSDALLAAHQLIQDGLLNNPNIMVTLNKRCKWLGEEGECRYSRGLTMAEWCLLVCKYVSIMSGEFGQAKQACSLLVRLHDHSLLFKHNQVLLRVAMTECALLANDYPTVLLAIRWFVKQPGMTTNSQFMSWLHGHVIKAGQHGRDCWLSSTPFARFLHRHCRHQDPTWLVVQGHLYAMSGSWEEALRTYTLLPDSIGAVKKQSLFSAYYHRAQQRTCRTRRWYLLKALCQLDQLENNNTTMYNKARCLHGLGVMDGAVRHYQSVIDSASESDFGIKLAAEYNLQLILER